MDYKFSNKSQCIQSSQTLAINARKLQMQADGIDVVNFGAGEPDFPTPEHVRQAGIDAINQGYTRYTPNSGYPELRSAIAERLNKVLETKYNSSNVLVCNGGKHALINAFLTLCEEGDDVIIPAPYWVSYPEQVKLTGANPVILPTTEEDGFRFDGDRLHKYLTPRTRLLVLNSPSNPTGAVYSYAELKTIAEVVEDMRLIVITDEVYSEMVYDNLKHYSLASFPEIHDQVVVTSSLSKTYSMTGWRLGFMVASEEITRTAAKIQSQMTSNACSISQRAGIEALRGPQDCIVEMRNAFNERRLFIHRRLNSLKGISCLLPEGAFFLMARISDYFGKSYDGNAINDSFDMTEYLLDKAHTVVMPGDAFGAKEYIRISYAISIEEIEEGINRIENALEKLS